MLIVDSWLAGSYTGFADTLEVFEETAVSHQFRHDVDRLVLGADRIQLDELLMSQLLHDLSLRQEVFRIHRACNISYKLVSTY